MLCTHHIYSIALYTLNTQSIYKTQSHFNRICMQYKLSPLWAQTHYDYRNNYWNCLCKRGRCGWSMTKSTCSVITFMSRFINMLIWAFHGSCWRILLLFCSIRTVPRPCTRVVWFIINLFIGSCLLTKCLTILTLHWKEISNKCATGKHQENIKGRLGHTLYKKPNQGLQLTLHCSHSNQ